MWKTLMVLALSGAGTALACDLDDCDLATELHLERAGAGWVPEDRWTWMNHDLALARSWLADNPAQTRQIVATLDSAMRAQLEDLVRARGAERTAMLHNALALLMVEAGGKPLASLSLESPKPRKSRLRVALRLGHPDEAPEPEAFVGEPDDEDDEAVGQTREERQRDRDQERARDRERSRELTRADRSEPAEPREIERAGRDPRP